MLVGASVICLAQPQSLLTHHMRDVVANGQAKLLHPMPANQTMRIDLVLPMRDRAGLQDFLREVYDPTSPIYHHFLTVEDRTNMFGPTPEDYNAVVAFARAHGLTVVGGSREAMDVQVQGSVGAIESAFHVAMNVYQHPTENRTFYSPDREPTVDLPFQLWHISGLDNYSIPRPNLLKRMEVPGVHSNATTGSCPSKSFCGSDMRAAYYGGTSLTGNAQNIGLLEYLGFDIADVNTYYTNAGQTRTAAVTGISTDGSSLNCTYPSCDDTEQTLDITQALGMAPGVTTLYVYVGNTDTALLGGMSSDLPLPLQLSCSWSWTPADPSTDDPYFETMAAQGQSFFTASGDSGKWKSSNIYNYPQEDANVITVGGTDLTTSSAGGPWASETAWSSSGGGISPDKIAIPSWQQLAGVITGSNQGSTVYRNGPDVSANANYTFYVCADQRSCTANLYGGTSFAAPMWAGYMALINEQAATNGDPAPGFINPALYPLALGTTYSTLFHDITSGSNGFPAVTGYDLVTGWGSPNTNGLINAFAPAAASFSISAMPSKVTVKRGAVAKGKIISTIQNGFDSAVTLSSSLKGVVISPNPIPAPGSGTASWFFKVPANAKTGTFTVTFTGSGGSLSETATVTLTITQ